MSDPLDLDAIESLIEDIVCCADEADGDKVDAEAYARQLVTVARAPLLAEVDALRAKLAAPREIVAWCSEHGSDSHPRCETCAAALAAQTAPVAPPMPQCPHGENCACAILTRHEWHVAFCDEREKNQAPPPAVAPPTPTMADAAEMLWVVLANVSGGDWTQQSAEWQEAAARWRDYYFAAVRAAAAPPQGWQPIATLPQAGIFLFGRAGLCHVVMGWNDSTKDYGIEIESGRGIWFEPTHWQPLPAPPEVPHD